MNYKIAIIYPSLILKTFWVKQLLTSLKSFDLVLITGKVEKNKYRKYHKIILNSFPLIFLKKLKDYKIFPNFLDRFILLKLQKLNIDVLIVNFLTQAINYDHLIARVKIPVIVHVHGKDVTWDYVSPITGNLHHNSNHKEKARQLSENVCFIANSKYTEKKLLEAGIDNTKIHIKYFGMELHRKMPILRSKDSINFLFLGRLIDTKDPVNLIKSFIKAKNAGLKGTLTIAGDGDLFQVCDELIKKSKWKQDISLLGWVTHSKAYDLYKSHQCFVLPNQKGPLTNQEEAFGVVFLEAMSFGLPVIGGDSGGVPEIIEHKVNGLLYNKTKDNLWEFLIEVENDKKLFEVMSFNAINTIKEEFSIKNEAARMKEIINLVRKKSDDLP